MDNRIWLDSMPRFDSSGSESEGITLPPEWIPDNVQGGVGEPWDKLVDHFIAMLSDGADCINDVESAYRTSAACFAAMESARRGGPVKVQA